MRHKERLAVMLRQLREAQGLSAEQLARSSSLNVATIRRWEEAEHMPRLTELDAGLTALRAGPTQRAAVLALLDTPRGLAADREEIRRKRNDATDEAWMPGTGDLWRAMRCRSGITGSQVAERLRLDPSQVTRWEKSQTPPPQDLVPSLFDLLQARPEERAVLANCRVRLPTPTASRSWDDFESCILQWRERSLRGDDFAGDLCFLVLESELAPRAVRHNAARHLLAFARISHGYWLEKQGRLAEARVSAGRALHLLPKQGVPVSEGWWFEGVRFVALSLAVYPPGVREKSRKKAAREAVAFTNRYRDAAGNSAPSHRNVLCRDMAEYWGMAGEIDVALGIIGEAEKWAMQAESEADQINTAQIRVSLLIGAGRGREAVRALPRLVDPEQDAAGAVWGQLRHAEAHRAAGNRNEACEHLRHFFDLTERFHQEHLRSHGDVIARLL